MTSDQSPESGERGMSALGRFVLWAIWLLVVAIAAATFVLFPPVATTRRDLPAYLAYGVGLMWSPACSFVGALITSSRPGNRMGWLLVGLGQLVTLTIFASGASLTEHPAKDMFNILSDVGFVFWVSAFALLILLFPDGRPLSPRWRPVVWLLALWPPFFLLMALVLAPEELLAESPSGAPPEVVLIVLMIVTMITACISAFLRFARSRGTERQQLKWFAYATTVGLTVAVIGSAIPVWGGVLTSLGLGGPLAGIAVALFRYRLYDIDVLINRTFVYGSLVAILAGLYAASIQLFKVIFVALTGDESDVAIVITTLILATTFTPIKNRLEEIAKRRFKEPEEGPASSAAQATEPLERIEAELRELREQVARLEAERSTADSRR
jgi:hypothetical protein